MRITLVGSRHFGVTTLNMLRQHGVEVARVVVADGEDRLAAAARDAGIEVAVQANPRLVVASEIAPDTDLIIAAHSHARVGKDALAAASSAASAIIPPCCPAIAALRRSSGPSSKAIRSQAARSITSPTAWMPAPSPCRTGVL